MKKLLRLTLLLVLLVAEIAGHAQETGQSKNYHFRGSALVTNNGISLLPSFTLEKPAAIFDLSVGDKLSFEPQLRFNLQDGEPWSFIFWWRYRFASESKFKFSMGAHPAILFANTQSMINGQLEEGLVIKRYIAGELSPNYQISKKVSVGLYYLTSHGFDLGATRNVHFLTLNTRISNLELGRGLVFGLHPQVYYLRMDDKEGYYVTSTFSLNKEDFPLSIQSIVNKKLDSEIGGDELVWNVSLIYAFGGNYIRH